MTYANFLPQGFTGRAMIRGDLLPAALQADALRAYLHLFTREHVPQWARKPRDNGEPYPVQFASDREWLARTLFPVTVRKGGKLGDHTRAGNAHCRSFPSWPDGVTENDKARGFGTVADIVPVVELAQ